MKKWFDIGINLVVIGMAGVLIFTFFHYHLAPWQHAIEPAHIEAGRTLPPIRGVDFSHAQQTLVLDIRNGCHFCEDSMGFYQNILALKSEGKISIPVIAVLPDPPSVAKKFVSSHGLSLPVVPNVNPSSIGVTGTPTMILVNAKGIVQQVWLGEQSQAAQTGVIAELEALSGTGTPRREVSATKD